MPPERLGDRFKRTNSMLQQTGPPTEIGALITKLGERGVFKVDGRALE
jgi:hypothetical protein